MVNPRITQVTPFDWEIASETRSGVWYFVTRFSCSCPGFSRHGRPGWMCKHVAAVRRIYGQPLVRFPQQPAVALPQHDEPQTAA